MLIQIIKSLVFSYCKNKIRRENHATGGGTLKEIGDIMKHLIKISTTLYLKLCNVR